MRTKYSSGLDVQESLQQLKFHRETETTKLFEDGIQYHDNTRLADSLYKRVRVLCWILSSPDNLKRKAQHVRATWAKRCNIVIFISSKTNTNFPAVGFNTTEGVYHVTAKTMHAFKYCWDYYRDQADWFLKADDDSFVILENLRYFLSAYKRTDPLYFGHKFKTKLKQDYFQGGAGYVLSHEALRRFGEKGFQDPKHCRPKGGAEDIEIAKCMEHLGVTMGDSRDAMGRSRFHVFNPPIQLEGRFPAWYYKHDAHGAPYGPESISKYAVSFHSVEPQMMYHLDYYIYHLRPYGIVTGNMERNAKP
ncbi:unnamed protein product [Owenia fusiformis]|uniref:Glycoprotein-N-acetylgalactosamine 3-beta-galactosyltransferase 1 n=1 Tax=Owenia fusiformis TaxID=6347 RepID=A0A8J1U752_OWEFU|nr:unnamed protein product [Owenia fusiformis]